MNDSLDMIHLKLEMAEKINKELIGEAANNKKIIASQQRRIEELNDRCHACGASKLEYQYISERLVDFIEATEKAVGWYEEVYCHADAKIRSEGPERIIEGLRCLLDNKVDENALEKELEAVKAWNEVAVQMNRDLTKYISDNYNIEGDEYGTYVQGLQLVINKVREEYTR